MAGNVPPESSWYAVQRLNHWMELLNIETEDVSVLLCPEVGRKTGDYHMDVYARYEGDRGWDASWDMQVDYAELDIDYVDFVEEYSVWRNRFEEELEEADLYCPDHF